jgi:hypothetical protein
MVGLSVINKNSAGELGQTCLGSSHWNVSRQLSVVSRRMTKEIPGLSDPTAFHMPKATKGFTCERRF